MLTFRVIEFEIDQNQSEDTERQSHSRAIFLKSLLHWYRSERKHIFPNGIIAGFDSPTLNMRLVDRIRMIFDIIYRAEQQSFRFIYRFEESNANQADILINQSVKRLCDSLDRNVVAVNPI